MSKISRILTNCVTINVDASFDSDYNVGGYAFIICFEKQRKYGSGIIEINRCKNSTEAEMFGIWKALECIDYLNPLPISKWFIINCDSKSAMSRINKPLSHDQSAIIINKIYWRVIRSIQSTRNEFRHVKGHSSKKEARNKANNWCDEEARKIMREYRNEFKMRSNTKKRFDFKSV